MGARGYFGKPVNQLTLEEGALLASLIKGPNYFNPDRHPARAQERLAYVYKRMREDGLLPTAQPGPGLPALVAYEWSRHDVGFYVVDHVARELKSVAGIEVNTANPSMVHSTIDLKLQRAVEESLQEGLSRYERRAGRAQFSGPEANLAKAVELAQADFEGGADVFAAEPRFAQRVEDAAGGGQNRNVRASTRSVLSRIAPRRKIPSVCAPLYPLPSRLLWGSEASPSV
jgi:membrane carboxypeptidase/penicillin-binding protein